MEDGRLATDAMTVDDFLFSPEKHPGGNALLVPAGKEAYMQFVDPRSLGRIRGAKLRDRFLSGHTGFEGRNPSLALAGARASAADAARHSAEAELSRLRAHRVHKGKAVPYPPPLCHRPPTRSAQARGTPAGWRAALGALGAGGASLPVRRPCSCTHAAPRAPCS